MKEAIIDKLKYKFDDKHLLCYKPCGGCKYLGDLDIAPVTESVAYAGFWMCRHCGNNTGSFTRREIDKVCDALGVD